MTSDMSGGQPDQGEPNYLLWTMVGLLAAVTAVVLVILALD